MRGSVSYESLLHERTIAEKQIMLESIKQFREIEHKFAQ